MSYKPSYRDEESFKEAAITLAVDLSSAIEWIANNLSPGDVFSEDELRGWAKENMEEL